MYDLLQPLIVYSIYLIVIIVMWHYAIPKVVKKEIKKYLGIFFKWLLFGRRPGDKKKNEDKPVDKGPRVETIDVDVWRKKS